MGPLGPYPDPVGSAEVCSPLLEKKDFIV